MVVLDRRNEWNTHTWSWRILLFASIFFRRSSAGSAHLLLLLFRSRILRPISRLVLHQYYSHHSIIVLSCDPASAHLACLLIRRSISLLLGLPCTPSIARVDVLSLEYKQQRRSLRL